MGNRVHPLRTVLICASIVGNALFGGAMYTFPLLTPVLSSRLKLTQPQLSSIILAGMAIQYPFAAFVGKLIDWKGPALVSFFAAIFFSLAFGLASWQLSNVPIDIEEASTHSFQLLTVCFAFAGVGTTFSIFTSLLTAAKAFPRQTGTASGVTMALFGLSPLFFSCIASGLFTEPVEGLNAPHYLRFIAVGTGVVFLFGALVMRVPSSDIKDDRPEIPDEQTRLLQDESRAASVPELHKDSIEVVLRDQTFWLLAFVLVILLGVCEMILSNIGTIVISLPSKIIPHHSGISDDTAASAQVQLLSLANTVSRFVVGPLADYLGPRDGVIQSKRQLSRMAFIAGPALLMCLSMGAVISFVRSRETMWILSVCTGIAYGTTFTVVPAIVSNVWGVANLGRNFGIITYAPFIGNPLFSYLYAFVSDSHSRGQIVCRGAQCWLLTMFVGMVACAVAFLASLVLWRKWRGTV